jgi:predicted peptidase
MNYDTKINIYFFQNRVLKWAFFILIYTFIRFESLYAQQNENNTLNKNKELFETINNTLTYFCYDSTLTLDSSVVLVIYCHGAEERIQKTQKGYVMQRVYQLGHAFAKEDFLFAAGNFTLDPISNTRAITQIEELRKWCQLEFGIYPKIQIIGYSLGGYAVMLYSKKYPKHVSLITTVAGTLINHVWFKYPNSITSIKNIPIRMFHGDKDVNVEYKNSVEFLNFFNKRGFNIKLNTYPDAHHSNIHDRALTDLVNTHKKHRIENGKSQKTEEKKIIYSLIWLLD